MTRWRVERSWYAQAMGLPLATHLLTVRLNVALGAPAPSLVQLGPWYVLIAVFVVRLINPLSGPLGEGPGWRGFAEPRLQANRSPLLASLILALLVASWHLPL
jgi:membrane protease YdiL (CAAX protease family)